MRIEPTKSLAAVLGALLLGLVAPAALADEDPSEEYERLRNQSDREYDAGHYRESEKITGQMVRLAETALSDKPLFLSGALNDRAAAIYEQGRYAEAEVLFKRSLEIKERVKGPDDPWVATGLHNLAELYGRQGRYAEAEPLSRRALAIREKSFGAESSEAATCLASLAGFCRHLGRNAEAELLQKRALAIQVKSLGPDATDVAYSYQGLGLLYWSQARYEDAEQYFRRALAMHEKTFGPDHPDVAIVLNNLAVVCDDQDRRAEGEPLHKRALAIREKTLGPDHLKVATTLNNLAVSYDDQGRYAESEPIYRRVLAIREKARGRYDLELATPLNNLALACKEQGRFEEAETLASRAIEIVDAATGEADLRCTCYGNRAKARWAAGKKEAALDDLRRAMDIAEQIRVQASGAEPQRAAVFATRIHLFETMVAWQAESGGAAEALAAMERGRARSLLDQMESRGIDLLAGMAPAEAERLRQRESHAQVRIAQLELQLQAAYRRPDLSDAERKEQVEPLDAQLRQAQADYVSAYADIRNASPAYRLTLGQDRKPVPLQTLLEWATSRQALLLEYCIGADGAYALVVPAGGKGRLEKLTVSQAQAAALGIEPGLLTARRLQQALVNEQGTGLLQRVRKPGQSALPGEVARGLAALWELVVPQAERAALVDAKFKRLVVIPDGPLAELPFEVLLVKNGESPQYVLDLPAPIEYAPSASILVNLAARPPASQRPASQPVLTVGDARYGPPAAPDAQVAQLGPRSRYQSSGGSLAALPFSAWEVAWVAEVFSSNGIGAARLQAEQATEANLRSQAAGRRVVHLACHGLVDRAYGNLFGAMALTPGPQAASDPSDDGFLTLAEIPQLNLQGCELAILSACETNLGPRQRGEGVAALSRGFLVAGSRRVVASNWLVDDEAAAGLVSYFCGGLAAAEKKDQSPDYAQALQAAKRWVRKQEKWQSPYYWGTFELIGPH